MNALKQHLSENEKKYLEEIEKIHAKIDAKESYANQRSALKEGRRADNKQEDC